MSDEVEPIFQPAIAERLVELLGELATGRLIETYLGEAPQLLTALASGIAESDAEAALLASHSLKSSSGMVGALRLCALASRVEAMTKSHDLAAAGLLVDTLQDAFDQVRDVLSAECARLSRGPT